MLDKEEITKNDLETKDISNEQQEEKDTSLGYKVCYIFMASCVLCATALVIALTLRFIRWILF